MNTADKVIDYLIKDGNSDTCGTGNFLVEIFARKLTHCKDERDGLKALNSIFAIELLQDNVDEARARLLQMYKDHFPNASTFAVMVAEKIIKNNIIQGNTLEMTEWLEKGEWNTII